MDEWMLPASLPVRADPPLVELADGGGFAGVRVVREEAAASLSAHTVQEVPEHNTGSDIRSSDYRVYN